MIKKLSNNLFYLAIFLLPLQTRKILYIWGSGFNEWTSAYLYLTDIFLILAFLCSFWHLRKKRFFKNLSFGKIKEPDFWLFLFLIICFASLVYADNIRLGFYVFLRLLGLVLLFFYLKQIKLKTLAKIVILSGFVQSLIALYQYAYQEPLGWQFLQESPLNTEGGGIAKITIDNIEIIRAYGTFPHPNILAGFLILCLFLFYYIWLYKTHFLFKKCVLAVIFSFLFVALGLTYSRAAVFSFLLSSILYFIFILRRVLKKKNRLFKRRFIFLLLLFVLWLSLFSFLAWSEISVRFLISPKEQAVTLRLFYNELALNSINNHSWLGQGLGSFVWEARQRLDLMASWIHQPVHNIYLLIICEVGLIGFVVFLMFLWKVLKQKQINLFLTFILLSFLTISLFDHYFWTIWQGQIMLWLVLGMINKRKKLTLQ